VAKIIVILHGKDGEPDTMTFDNVTDETVLVNFIDGTVKMESREPPTLINADTGEPYPKQSP
jgi:hypothetical protein